MKILLAFALTVTIVLLPSVECEHPLYSFRCLEDGEIHLFGLHNNSEIKTLNDPTGQCNANKVTKESDLEYYRIPKACNESNSIQGNRIIQIVVHDPVIDRQKRNVISPSPSSPSTSTTGYSPGTTPVTTTAHLIERVNTHSFNITCKSIPEDGVNRTVVHVFQENVYNNLPENNMEVNGVEMRFKAVNDKDSPDINTIYVGDEFYMFLEYMGTKDYSLVPKKCTAYSGTSLSSESNTKVELWNRDGSTVCNQHDELLEWFQKKSSKLIYSKMFGFRFSDSEYITIRCEVGIFPRGPPQPLCKHTTTSAPNGRKRRGIENVEVKTKFAASKIRVYDNKDMYQMENNSSQKSFDISVWIVLVIGTLLKRW